MDFLIFISNLEVVVVTLRGCVYKIDVWTGEAVWRLALEQPVFSTPLLVAGCEARLVVATVTSALHLLNTATGLLVSSFATPGPVFGSPVRPGPGPALCVGCQDGSVLRVTVRDTDLLDTAWRTQLGAGVAASPDVLDGGRVLAVCTTRGVLHLLVAATGELLLSSSQLPGEIFSSPLVYRDNIVVGCRDNNLYCYQLSQDDDESDAGNNDISAEHVAIP